MSLNDAGNYYGTPRPVHISADSPPITYQEHRNLLRNFRTRSKSLSNLEKAAEDGDNSEDDSGLSGKYWLSALFMAACVEYKSEESGFEGKKKTRQRVSDLLPPEKEPSAPRAAAKSRIQPLCTALVPDTPINQSLAQLACWKVSVGLWHHRSLDHFQRKVRLC